MGGILKLAIVAGIIWLVYQNLMRSVATTGNRSAEPGSPATMRPCSYCGVHIPEGESSQSRGHFFCCEAHRNAFFERQP